MQTSPLSQLLPPGAPALLPEGPATSNPPFSSAGLRLGFQTGRAPTRPPLTSGLEAHWSCQVSRQRVFSSDRAHPGKRHPRGCWPWCLLLRVVLGTGALRPAHFLASRKGLWKPTGSFKSTGPDGSDQKPKTRELLSTPCARLTTAPAEFCPVGVIRTQMLTTACSGRPLGARHRSLIPTITVRERCGF